MGIDTHVKDFMICDNCKNCVLSNQHVKIDNSEIGLCVYLALFIENYESEMHEMVRKHLGVKTK